MGTYVLLNIPLTLFLTDTLSSIVDGGSFLLSPSHLPLLVPLDGKHASPLNYCVCKHDSYAGFNLGIPALALPVLISRPLEPRVVSKLGHQLGFFLLASPLHLEELVVLAVDKGEEALTEGSKGDDLG